MIQGNGTAVASLTVCAADQFDWTDSVLAHLENKGYLIHRIKLVELRELAPSGTPPDAIITVNPEDSISLTRMMKDTYGNRAQPLHVLITDRFSPDLLLNECADLVLPPYPQIIEHQLSQMLRLRQANEQLRENIQGLKKENEQLKSEITAQQKASKSVELLKTAIVRNVSHELKTPLLQVKSAVSLLAEDVENEELINYAKNATARLETLVKNITMLGSSLHTNISTVIVRDAVEYARRNLGRIWMQVDAPERIQINIEPNLPPITADKQGISTALQLLLDNALKFSKDSENDDVEVIAKRQGENVYIAVKDYGIGIAREDIERIFETFYQVDSSSTRRYGGTGVGLAIVKLILDNHDTEIHVDSVVGKGTTFWFLLPLVEMHNVEV